MLSRMSRRPAQRRRIQKDNDQHSADTDSDTRVHSDGEGFELVRQKGFKKRRTQQKKGPAGREVPGTSKEQLVTRPKQTKFPEPEEDDQQSQSQQNQQNQPSPQSSSIQGSPQTSPYHPDIGESNGTVLGTDIQDETSTSDYEDTKSQEEKKQEEEEEEEMPTEIQETQLTDSYPQPGQHHRDNTTNLT